MRFKSFRFVNFRGIKDTTLHLSSKVNAHINVLVGLNESGKTTILEGIHHFRFNPDLLNKLPSLIGRRNYQAMLPIGMRALFDGMIEIIATVEVTPQDWNKVDQFLKDEYKFKSSTPVKTIEINHQITFKDSKYESSTNLWNLQFKGTRRNKSVRLNDGDWLKAANFVGGLLPHIVYFPSTLLEFPDQIVLENKATSTSTPKNEFYCEVLKDVLKAINPALDFDKHLIQRGKSKLSSEKANLEALLLQIGKHLKKTIFSEWEKIFGKSLGEKDFIVKLEHVRGQLCLEVKLVTADGIFSINERSAGFRWFFAFILLTRYRLNRQDNVLFLFDEPAANLHPNAQTMLLKSFELLSASADIIYSTHSHYLINPLWLESTHVVQNIHTEDTGLLDEDPLQNSIQVTPYRTFVGSHPEQYYFYRPIQEALDYSPSPLEFPSKAILVEGKTDFFALQYLSSQLKLKCSKPYIFPGGGAGTLDPLISLLYGWGKNFVIILDSDEAGETQKKRYIEKFEEIVAGKIFSFKDINSAWKNYRIEQLIHKDDIERIRADRFPSLKKLGKKQLHIAIQELLRLEKPLPLAKGTQDNIAQILEFLDQKLSNSKPQ